MKRKVLITNFIYSALFILLVAADRITKKCAAAYLMKGDKELIPGVLSFHYLENRGAAWGFLAVFYHNAYRNPVYGNVLCQNPV